MAFKCEEVNEKLRKKIEEENGILTGIKEISSWMIDEERGIVVWMQPSTLKKIDGEKIVFMGRKLKVILGEGFQDQYKILKT